VDFKDLIQNAIALIAVVTSAVALIRTRRFETKQIEFQETADRLTRLQTELLEREENERQTRLRQTAIASEREAQARTEVQKREAAAVARGSMHMYWSLHFGEERLTVMNDGRVPVRRVGLIPRLASGDLPAQLQHDLNEKFPISVLKPGEVTFFRCHGMPVQNSEVHVRLEWSTDAGRFFMEGKGTTLASYSTPILPVQEF
jgi:hypothetical protein